MGLGMIQADSNGDVIRVSLSARFTKEFKDEADADQTVLVALEPNEAALREIADDMDGHRIVGGIVKKGNVPVVFDTGDDDHATAKFLEGLTAPQRQALRAGRNAVVQGLVPNSSNVEKAIADIVQRLMRLED